MKKQFEHSLDRAILEMQGQVSWVSLQFNLMCCLVLFFFVTLIVTCVRLLRLRRQTFDIVNSQAPKPIKQKRGGLCAEASESEETEDRETDNLTEKILVRGL